LLPSTTRTHERWEREAIEDQAIGIGMASILRASAVGGNPQSIAQSTPAIGVTHVFIHNYAFQYYCIEHQDMIGIVTVT